jgi:diacylglycerol kinase
MSYLKNRFKAFDFAFSGIHLAFKSEKNLQLQLIIAVFVIAAGFYFSILKEEWIAILLCITIVIALEMFNSAVEKLCDLYSKEQDQKIKYIKDVCAGAVLFGSVLAAIIGGLVFWPYIIKLI